jgi:electron transfer flavoprotein beta subunit
VIRYKRARTPGEVVSQVQVELPDADEAARETEVGRRVERLQMKGLLIEQWDLDAIEADLQWCGLAGSPTKVHRVQSIVLTKEGYTEVPPTEEGIRQMVHELIVDHTLG